MPYATYRFNKIIAAETIRFIVTVAIVVYKGLKLVVYRMLTVYHLTPSFSPVGVTGFEPATTRPPDAYSNVCISLIINVISFLLVPWLTFWLTFIAKNQEWLVMK